MPRGVCLCLCLCVLALLLAARPAAAANLTVCASGCQFSSVQAAVDAAAPGDVVLLRAGQTFVTNLVLRAKSSTSTSYITIRSDASDSSLPAAGTRLVPPGKAGANVAAGVLARLVGQTGTWRTTPVVRTEPGAHHYRLQFLDLDGASSDGYDTLVALGENSATQTSSNVPHHVTLDRVYLHGQAVKGMKRGVALNSRDTEILNSYLSDFKNIDDAQSIGGFNGPGPFRIVNNHLEASGENVMFGGSDPKTLNLVPSDIEIRANRIVKSLTWQDPVLATPPRPTASAGSGGSLAAGTHYFKVVAVLSSAGTDVLSAASPETAVTVGGSGAVSLSWTAVANASWYRVYRGTSAGGQSRYVTVTGRTLTYTGAGETSGAPPSSAMRWTVKNLLELKNARRVTIDGNLFEYHWQAAQVGYAIVFTPRNQEGTAPWSVVRDVTFSNNVVRHVASGINILGSDYEATSQVTTNIRVLNNLFYDVDTTWGNGGRWMVITRSPVNVTIDHNTILHSGTIIDVESGQVSGFVYRNNLSRHNGYGIIGRDHAAGTDTLNAYFPGWVFARNVLAGGTASAYPSGNEFPSVSTFMGSFVDAAAGDYALVAGSPWKASGTDGKDLGIDTAALVSAQLSGSNPSPNLTISGSGGGSGGGTGGAVTPGGSTTVLPAGWTSEDIGAVALSGAAGESAGTYTVSGNGADIWGSSDAFRFAWQPLTGDGTIVARIAALTGADAWTKAGVMIRASTAPGAAHALMLASRGRGLAFQRRTTAGGQSTNTAGPLVPAPVWLRLSRAGSLITASWSADGLSWTTLGQEAIALPSTVLVGLAVTSHDTTTLATGTFDRVSISSGAGLPSGWSASDVGSVGVAGVATASGGSFTVRGAGADIWGNQDAFAYVWRTLAGDGRITARVASLSGTDDWTKAGVMVRQTLDPGSAHGLALVSVGKGLAFQRRTITGGSSTHSGLAGTAPEWVRLSRTGTTVTAAVSSDGVTWRTVGSDTVSLTGAISVGLAVTSHDTTRLATATFDNVTVSTTP